MAQPFRTFVAIPLGGSVRQKAGEVIGRLSVAQAKVKWVEPHNLHWTLQFLGNVDGEEAHRICQTVAEAVSPLPAFHVDVRGVGAFPSLGNPRIVWLGAGQGRDELVIVHDAIEAALEPLGFRPEGRQFKPHVTLGRVRGGAPEVRRLGDLIRENQDFNAGSMDVSEVLVYSSRLGRGGPDYEVLGTAELEG